MTGRVHSVSKAGLGAGSVLMLLALAACGGGDDSSDSEGSVDSGNEADSSSSSASDNEAVEEVTGEFYDFTHAPVTEATVGPADEITLMVSDELLEVAGEQDSDYPANKVFDTITVSAGDHPESQCAVEVEYGYADGSRELIEDTDWHRVVAYEDNIREGETEVTRLEGGQTEVFGGTSGESILVATSQNERDSHAFLGRAEALFSSLAADRTSATIPVTCASAPGNGDTASVYFTQLSVDEVDTEDVMDWAVDGDGTRYESDVFAEAEVWVMASGDIGITSSEVEGYYFGFDERIEEVHGWIPDGYAIDSQGNLIEQ